MSPSATCIISLAIVLFAIISLMPVTRAYVRIVPGTKCYDHEDHEYCYDSYLHIAVPQNVVVQRTGRCEIMRCGTDYALYIAGCGGIRAGPGYYATAKDYSKPYPECCPRLAPITQTSL